jgi:hypothetical protein
MSLTAPNRRIEHVDGHDQANTSHFAQKALAFLEINLQFKQTTRAPERALVQRRRRTAPEQGRPASGARAQAPEQRQPPEQSLDLHYVLEKEKRREKKRREEKGGGVAAKCRSTGREERRGEE